MKDDMKQELKKIEDHFEEAPLCHVHLDGSKESLEMKHFLNEIEEELEKIQIEYIYDERERDLDLPFIKIESGDGLRGRMFFHGVPKEHEFPSFLAALYQAAGPGQPLMDDMLKKIRKIVTPVRLDVGVTTSCPHCPPMASSTLTIASYCPQIETHIYIVSAFPAFREKYNITSVPCLIINKEGKYLGRRSVEEIVALVEKEIEKKK